MLCQEDLGIHMPSLAPRLSTAIPWAEVGTTISFYLMLSFVSMSQVLPASRKKEKGNPSPLRFLDGFSTCSSHCPKEHLIASIL